MGKPMGAGAITSFEAIPGALYLPRLGIATIRNHFTELLETLQARSR